jgi:hypothetical protein
MTGTVFWLRVLGPGHSTLPRVWGALDGGKPASVATITERGSPRAGLQARPLLVAGGRAAITASPRSLPTFQVASGLGLTRSQRRPPLASAAQPLSRPPLDRATRPTQPASARPPIPEVTGPPPHSHPATPTPAPGPAIPTPAPSPPMPTTDPAPPAPTVPPAPVSQPTPAPPQPAIEPPPIDEPTPPPSQEPTPDHERDSNNQPTPPPVTNPAPTGTDQRVLASATTS